MSDSPVIYADLGDGKQRRFFLGSDELSMFKREVGRGYYTLYTQFTQNAEPAEVRAIIRLALIGGGTDPVDATELSQYYAAPPRPMKAAYLIAFNALSAVWNGVEPSKSGGKLSVEEMDRYFTDLEAALLKQGLDVSAIKGKSFAEVQAIMASMNKDEAQEAPDADTFNAIKAASTKGKKK